jgi:hypothetical protein
MHGNFNWVIESHVFCGVGVVTVGLVEIVEPFLHFGARRGAHLFDLGGQVEPRQVLLDYGMFEQLHYLVLH